MSHIPVHGGLDQPVDQVLPLSRRKAVIAEAASMPGIEVSLGDVSVVHRFADGTLSPLTGPMTEEEFNHVLETKTIRRGGADYAWTIPISLPVTDAERKALEPGHTASLLDPDGAVLGLLHVSSVFKWDKARYIKSVYGTSRTDHPGGDMVMNDERSWLVGGTIEALPQKENPYFGEFVLTPRETRTLIAQNKWEKTVAFQTRNPLHRAHEYALLYGLEELTRAGHFTGAVLNPLVGQLKGDDVDAKTRMETYEALIESEALGVGDADAALWDKVGFAPTEVLRLVGLDMKMFYGGPSEAVMHAVYRQNHGFSNIVIGRKHADAPYHDKTAIWGDFDAHGIMDDHAGELAIEAVKVGFAAYYESLGRVDLMGNHPDEKAFFISGSEVRRALMAGEQPDERIMRPSTARILIDSYAKRSVKA